MQATSNPGSSRPGPEARPHAANLAVLVSGGLDSAVLLGEARRDCATVHPLYLRSGLYWEHVESQCLKRFLAALDSTVLRPLTVLDSPVADLYGSHWSITGQGVPDATSSDEAVFLPGRNVLLLTKAMLWCHLHGVPAVALGSLGSNPFPDASLAFFSSFEYVVNQGTGGTVRVLRPYAGLSKTEVMLRGRSLPLELTFSCLRPVVDRHCGVCNKCNERRRAFAAAGMQDKTEYHSDAGSP